jgi:hypothetical protein
MYRTAGSRQAEVTSGKWSQTMMNVENPNAVAPIVLASSE